MSKKDILVLIGALAGGAAGYTAFRWMAGQGFYSLILPGGLAGIGAGCFQGRHKLVPFLCGAFGLALGIFSEWRLAPFSKDPALSYFLLHLHQLRPVTLIMILLGGSIAFWIPFRRRQPVAPSNP